MEKLRMETADMTGQNIEKIGRLFPNVITESKDKDGKLKKTINFDLLKQLLSDDVLEGDEAYEFTWVGKKASIVEANKPIRKTLRPCKEESKNWDTTGNLYIEGDNLDVLKLLQESYLEKVKMIYIDPPYNTGNDFVYRDNFTRDKDEYHAETGVYDEHGDRLFRNTESNGRFHSDWCSMMLPRLQLARNLLRDDGVIFISIDDNEIHNLKKICDEVFSPKNFLSQLIWISGRTSSSHFTNSHEYILAYSKNIDTLPLFKYCGEEEVVSDRAIKKPGVKNPISSIRFPRGIDFESEDKVFPLKFGDSEPVEIVEGVLECKNKKLNKPVVINCAWSMKEMINEWLNGKDVWDQKGQKIKRFFFKSNGVLQYEKFKGTVHPNTIITNITTKSGTNELQSLLGENLFQYPKPTDLIKYLLPASYIDSKDAIVLDFFSGSATTAHAVMQMNAEDNGNRKFIMVQMQEECAKESEAYKAGYKNICEIGKERIRRAGEKIKADAGILGQDLDIGFRVFKLDSTNMKDVYFAAKDYSQGQLKDLISNIKEDRTDMDLLFACLLKWGLPLSLAHKTEKIDGFDVHTINDGDLMACFADEVSEAVIREIAKRQPLRVVFRDSSFGTSPEKINVEEIFKLMSPKTTVKVI
jgi:adenine-specific DNA-methyltransferase